MAQLGELPLANLATIWLNAQVDPRMLGQVRGVGERLGALRAFVRLRLAHVNLRVKLQIRLATEYLQKQKNGKKKYLTLTLSEKYKEIKKRERIYYTSVNERLGEDES